MKPSQESWLPAYIGLGSNLDGPENQVRKAAQEIGTLDRSRLVMTSPLYRSAPMGGRDQPDYVNAAAALITRLTPRQLLDALLLIERRMGRRRDGERWGPRVIDLDLLMFAGRVVDEPGLTVPHPGICERNFVLYPLRDLAPDLRVPGRGSVRGLAASCCGDGIEPLDSPR